MAHDADDDRRRVSARTSMTSTARTSRRHRLAALALLALATALAPASGQSPPPRPRARGEAPAPQSAEEPVHPVHRLGRDALRARMTVCSATWTSMKHSGATVGLLWNDFSRQCLEGR